MCERHRGAGRETRGGNTKRCDSWATRKKRRGREAGMETLVEACVIILNGF